MNKLLFATAVFVMLGSTSALAADLGERMPMKAPMGTAIPSWAGLYIGGNVGYGWGTGKTDVLEVENIANSPTASFSSDDKPKGAVGGAQIGYNWQMGALVTGIEADIQGSAIKGSNRTGLPTFANAAPPTGFFSSSRELSWFGTVRGRLGFTLAPEFLLYGTGGLAYGGVHNTTNTFFSATDQLSADIKETRVGWSAGAGAEWMFARNWSAKAEYLFLDVGNSSAKPLPTLPGEVVRVTTTWHSQDHIVRAGVNYHFN